jgi:flagellar basal body-associated protein FliL
MLKLVGIGIWVILVTAGATFASVFLNSGKDSGEQEAADLGVEQLSTEMMSIPVIREGDVMGYLVMQLSFAADRAMLEDKKVDPVPFLRDAAFRTIFSDTDIDVRRLKKKDLDTLTTAIVQEANQQLGKELVRNVLFEQINYVKKEDIRNNAASNNGNGAN